MSEHKEIDQMRRKRSNSSEERPTSGHAWERADGDVYVRRDIEATLRVAPGESYGFRASVDGYDRTILCAELEEAMERAEELGNEARDSLASVERMLLRCGECDGGDGVRVRMPHGLVLSFLLKTAETATGAGQYCPASGSASWVMPSTPWGAVPTRGEWELLRGLVDAFYARVDDERIAVENRNVNRTRS